LAPGTRAGQHYLVDLTFTDIRQLADVAAGLRDVVSRHGLCRITSELVETVEYRAQLREDVEGAMGSLREFEALLCSEQPLDEPVQLLSANGRYTDRAFFRPRDVKGRGAIKWTRLSCRSFAANAWPSTPRSLPLG